MKKYVVKICVYSVVVAALFGGLLIATLHPGFNKQMSALWNAEEYTDLPTREIVPIIKKAKDAENGYTKAIIGDSVCNQIFNRFQKDNHVYATMGGNQAMTMAGDYILAIEFINAHPEATEVCLVLRSLTGSGFTNEGLCYQDFIIPLIMENTMGNLDEDIRADIQSVFGKIRLNSKMIQLVNASNVSRKLMLNSMDSNNYDNDVLSKELLTQLYDICQKKGVELHLIHAPMAESMQGDWDTERENTLRVYRGTELEPLVTAYMDSTLWFSDDYFRDSIHFGGEYAEDAFIREVIMKISQTTGLLEDFQS